MDSQNIDNNEIGLSQGSLNLRMKVKPLAPGELFYNYLKTDLSADKVVGNPYEIWIGTLNPTKPVRIGAQGSFIIYGNYKSFFEVIQNTGFLSQYTYEAHLPLQGTRGLKVGNVYKIDEDIVIYKTDTNPQFIGGDLAVYLGDNKWWNISNSKLPKDLYYVPPTRGEAREDSDYEFTDSITKNVKAALDSLYQTKAGLSPSGKIYIKQLPDQLLQRWSNNLVLGPFEVQHEKGYNVHDTLGVNPKYVAHESPNNRLEPHSVNVKGNLSVKSFKSNLVFGDTTDTKVLGVPGTNKVFGMPFNYNLNGFNSLTQDLGSADIENNLKVGNLTETSDIHFTGLSSNGTIAITNNKILANNDLILGNAEFDTFDNDTIAAIENYKSKIQIGTNISAVSPQADITYNIYNISSEAVTHTSDNFTVNAPEINLSKVKLITNTTNNNTNIEIPNIITCSLGQLQINSSNSINLNLNGNNMNLFGNGIGFPGPYDMTGASIYYNKSQNKLVVGLEDAGSHKGSVRIESLNGTITLFDSDLYTKLCYLTANYFSCGPGFNTTENNSSASNASYWAPADRTTFYNVFAGTFTSKDVALLLKPTTDTQIVEISVSVHNSNERNGIINIFINNSSGMSITATHHDKLTFTPIQATFENKSYYCVLLSVGTTGSTTSYYLNGFSESNDLNSCRIVDVSSLSSSTVIGTPQMSFSVPNILAMNGTIGNVNFLGNGYLKTSGDITVGADANQIKLSSSDGAILGKSLSTTGDISSSGKIKAGTKVTLDGSDGKISSTSVSTGSVASTGNITAGDGTNKITLSSSDGAITAKSISVTTLNLDGKSLLSGSYSGGILSLNI